METSKTTKSIQELGLEFYTQRTQHSFTKIFYRLKPGLHKYLYNLVQDYTTREAVIMNTFKNVWEKIDQYDPYYAFSTWVYRIAKNEALLSKRWSKRNYSLEEIIESGINIVKKFKNEFSTPDYEFFESNLEDEIQRLYNLVISEINNLPEVYRLVLTAREIHKKDYQTIANELKWPINTVRTRIRKGRELVRNSIKRSQPELVKKYYNS